MVLISYVFHQEIKKKINECHIQPISKERANYANNYLATATFL